MSGTPRRAALCAAFVTWAWSSQMSYDPLPDDSRLGPLLEALLQERAKADPERQSRFFTTLSGLARRQGRGLRHYVPHSSVDEGCAVRIGTDVVLSLRGKGFFIPGNDTQHLVLLDNKGRILDQLSCASNNRLTMFAPGDFRT